MLPFEDDTAVTDPDISLPEGKTSFKPEELYQFTRIKPFVLHYWESEFPSLKPGQKGAEGPAYTRADVEMILEIKRLLYDEGLTLPEARERLAGTDDPSVTAAGSATPKKEVKKKTAPRKIAEKPVSAKGSGHAPKKKKKTDRATPVAVKLPDKSRGKRGLPVEGASRSRVSLEELLPGNGGAAAVGSSRQKVKSKKGRPQVSAAKQSPSTDQTDALVMRHKLSAVLRELREMLTFLHKGDR